MRRLAAAAVAAALLTVAGCGEPARWETLGFDSEEECYRTHGWDGTTGDMFDRYRMFEHWCG